MERTFLRAPDAMKGFGIGHSTFYGRISEGLLPPPIKFGPRMSVWPSDELDAVMAAIVAGVSEDQIRALVADLVARRKGPQVPSPEAADANPAEALA